MNKPKYISPRVALLEIQAAMDGQEWSADTLEFIAAQLRAAGYAVRDPEDLIAEDEPA